MSNAVITGASRGIGFATALTLARAGHNVVAAMRNPAASPELARIAHAENLPIQIETLDVASDASVRDAFARILASGPVDALVNNAGVECMGSIEETPLSDFRACMETNYFGVIRCVQAVAGHMRQRRSGLIVNVSSVAGKISSSPSGPYASSKFAVEALSEALAQEMKPFNVRVAIVEPGIIDTRMARNIGHLPSSATIPRSAASPLSLKPPPSSPGAPPCPTNSGSIGVPRTTPPGAPPSSATSASTSPSTNPPRPGGSFHGRALTVSDIALLRRRRA